MINLPLILATLSSGLFWVGWEKFSLASRVKYIFWGSALMLLLESSFYAFLQYQLWSEGTALKYLLVPQGEGVSYFVFYVATRLFAHRLIALFFGLLLILAIFKLNKRFKGKFFEDGEAYLAGLGLFLSGYPGGFFYIVTAMGIYLLWHLLSSIKGGVGVRLSMFNLWLPTAVVVIALSDFWLKNTALWLTLQI